MLYMHLCHTSAGIAHAHGVANHDDEVDNVSSAQHVGKQMDSSLHYTRIIAQILTETIHIH